MIHFRSKASSSLKKVTAAEHLSEYELTEMAGTNVKDLKNDATWLVMCALLYDLSAK